MVDEPIVGGRHVRDYSVGFRYRARLFRHALNLSHRAADSPRFALTVVEPYPGAPGSEPDPILTVTADPVDDGADGHELVLRSAGPAELFGPWDQLGDIEAFVDRAAEIVCAKLLVDRGTFRSIPGSEPPEPWQQVGPDARPCIVCGQVLEEGATACEYCGAESY